MTISIGTSQAHMGIKLNSKRHHIEISFYIPDNKEIYENLESYKDEIESEAKHALILRNPQKTKKAEIIFEIPGLDFDNTNNYNSLMQQTLKHVVRLKDIYVKYMKQTGNV